MRRIRRIRQLVPTKFATVVHEQWQSEDSNEGGWRPVFIRWWMFLGRSYKVDRQLV